MARLHIHPVGLGLIFFGLLAWVIALGGIGASTAICNKERPKDDPTFCARAYQLDWWSVWFEFFLLLIMLLTCFTNAFERGRFIFLTYLGMVTVQLTIMAKNFITNSFVVFAKDGFNIKNNQDNAYNASAAGAVLLCMTNFALIIFIGLGATAPTNPQSQGYQAPGMGLGSTAMGASSLGMGMGMGLSSSQPVDKYQPSNF